MNKVLCIALLFSVCVFPDIRLTSSFAARPEDLIILLSTIFLLQERVLYDTFYVRMILIIFVIMFISIGFNERLLSINSFEFYNKIVKGLVVYNLFFNLMQDEKQLKLINKLLVVILVVMFIANILQFLMPSVPALGKFYGLYTTTNQLNMFERAAHSRIPRITGLIGNPNNNGICFLFLLGFAIDMWTLTKKYFLILIILACIVVIISTQSRTCFVAMGLISLVYMVSTGKVWLLLPAFGGYLIIELLNLKYLLLIFNVGEVKQTHSVAGRIDIWQNLFVMIKQQPLLGYGGYKEYFYTSGSYAESEYVLGWFRYGFIYLLIYIILLLQPAIISLNDLIRKKIHGEYFMLSAALAMLTGSISNTPFSNPRIFVLFTIIIAFYDSIRFHYRGDPADDDSNHTLLK